VTERKRARARAVAAHTHSTARIHAFAHSPWKAAPRKVGKKRRECDDECKEMIKRRRELVRQSKTTSSRQEVKTFFLPCCDHSFVCPAVHVKHAQRANLLSAIMHTAHKHAHARTSTHSAKTPTDTGPEPSACKAIRSGKQGSKLHQGAALHLIVTRSQPSSAGGNHHLMSIGVTGIGVMRAREREEERERERERERET